MRPAPGSVARRHSSVLLREGSACPSRQPWEEPGRKSDRTRQRLLDAANRQFRMHGYTATTAAAIAEEAGVTERTFFRYFPSKADVLAYNWQVRREVFNHVLTTSQAPDLVDAVGEAMHAFAETVRVDIEAGVENVPRVLRDREASTAAMRVLLAVEHDLAVEIAKRVWPLVRGLRSANRGVRDRRRVPSRAACGCRGRHHQLHHVPRRRRNERPLYSTIDDTPRR